MKSIYSLYIDNEYVSKVLEAYDELEGNEVLQLNESFKSSLLKELAKAIYDVEDKHRENDKQHEQRWKENGYSGKPSKSEKTFASIFGPLTEKSRYGNTTKSGIQGLKWSEINDNDFKQYKTDDKEFVKLLKSVYGKKINADIICCEPGTKNVVYFIKGYSKAGSDIKLYGFNKADNWQKGVAERTKTKYSYQQRALKFDEAIEVINGLDIYVLEITDDMIKDYSELHTGREESQKGVINYDKASLEKLLKEQKARYKTLVDKMKADKLQSNDSDLFDDIKKTNDDVISLYEKVMSNPENLDKYYDMGRLMTYVSYAYESFYKSKQNKRKGDRNEEKYGKGTGKYDYASSDESIRDAKDYIEKVKKMIKEIEENLK